VRAFAEGSAEVSRCLVPPALVGAGRACRRWLLLVVDTLRSAVGAPDYQHVHCSTDTLYSLHTIAAGFAHFLPEWVASVRQQY